MEGMGKAYREGVFRLVRGIFLAVCAFGIIWTALAVADLALGLRGYSWSMVPLGLAFAAAAYGGSLFIALIARLGRQIGR